MRINLMLAVNDPTTGAYVGLADMVEVDGIISIEGAAVRCIADGGMLELDGIYYPLKDYQTWAGNWCWDCATLESVHAARILNHLRAQGWQYYEAEVTLADKWDAGQDVTAEELEALLREAGRE